MVRPLGAVAAALVVAVAPIRGLAPAAQRSVVRRAPMMFATTLGEGELGDATELSDSFDGAVQDAWRGLNRALGDGYTKLRLDFDTSMGDATYTRLSQSLEFARDEPGRKRVRNSQLQRLLSRSFSTRFG